MRSWNRRSHALLFFVTMIPAVLLAAFFLFVGVAELIGSRLPEEALSENTLVCVMLILTATALIYALFRPYSGGLFLCIWTLPFGFLFNAFRISNVLYPSRPAGYTHFWSVITVLVLLLGVLSVIRGRFSGKTTGH